MGTPRIRCIQPSGTAGDDTVYYSRDGRKDVIRCGPGKDTVLATSAEAAPLEDPDFEPFRLWA